MTDIDRALVALEEITRTLAELSTPEEARRLETLAAAARRYARSIDDRNYATEIQLRAGRRGGQMLIEMAERQERSEGGRTTDGQSAVLPTLVDLGVGETRAAAQQRSSRWQTLARKSDAVFEEYIRRIKSRAEALTVPGAAVGNNSGEFEWYTPEPYIAAARRVMEVIDLDPASNAEANEIVRADAIYTASDSGLDHGWRGHVWMNPPYAQPLVTLFCGKLCEEVAQGNVEEAIALVNNATETAWFQAMAVVARAICFPVGRLRFWGPDGAVAAPLQGQAIFYFGDRAGVFHGEFRRFGVTVAVP